MSVQRMTEVQAREWKALLNAHAENQSLRAQLRSANKENARFKEALRYYAEHKGLLDAEVARAALASPQDKQERDG